MNTITIVYVCKWEIDDRDSQGTFYSTDKIRKIFYKLDDALKYIESIENQKYPPLVDELRNMNAEYDIGFYLYQRTYPIE